MKVWDERAGQLIASADDRPDRVAVPAAAAAREPAGDRRLESSQPVLTVIIKTLNEASKIGACLASVLHATKDLPTQIIVADSRSDDATVGIAQEFGVNVVTLAPSEERSCGVGSQLGFQYAAGRYILLLDGDMRLNPAFLPDALGALEEDSGLAGVGGMIDLDAENLEYRLRRERGMPHLRSGIVDRLDGSGLYRRAAIESVGYLTNRNLHSYEELDLALRLRHAGWRLRRIATPAVSHHGHAMPALALLLRRWRNRYIDGQGEVLRAALGSKRVVSLAREFWLSFAVIAWWGSLVGYLLLALSLNLSLLPLLALLFLPLGAMLVKRRSLSLACYAVIQWQVCAAGLLRGFLRPQCDPTRPIQARIVHASPSFPVLSAQNRVRPTPEAPR